MVDFAKMLQQKRERHNIENRPNNLNASITVAGSDYAVRFGYDAALLKKLKDAIPESERTWHKTQKVWLISPEEIGMAINVIRIHTGYPLDLPIEKPSAPEVLEKTFLLEYLGATKDRGKTKSAYGSVNGQWASEFPEDVLKAFFEGREANSKPDGLQTLYQALCVLEKASSEEIKKAYKRLARQWHPDTCSEPDAHERFIKLNEAYQVLIDPEKKTRYDAGLYFERQSADQDFQHGRNRNGIARFPIGYRAPLRCGQITAKGTIRLMRFIVSDILKWDDVMNAQGQAVSQSVKDIVNLKQTVTRLLTA